MTDERNKAERALEDLVRDLPPGPAASPEFAKNLRASFSAGSIEAGSFVDDSEVDPADLTGVWSEELDDGTALDDTVPGRIKDSGPLSSPAAAAGATSSSTGPAKHTGRVFAFPVWAQAMTLAAAVALIVFVQNANRGAGPEQFQARGNGTIEIDGKTFALSELDAFRSLLEPGTAIHVEGDMSALLDFVYPGFMAVQVTPGVEMTIPEPAGRWFDRTASFGVDHGEVRVVTGPDFAGADLSILAPGTEIEVTGTTFAVICSPCSTCVCVLEGTAQMKDEDGKVQPVRPGRRQTFFNDNDDPPFEEPIRGEERMKLEMFRDSAVPRLRSEEQK